MATKTVVQVIDDLDGSELAVEDVEEARFSLDDNAYAIDLSKAHADELRTALQKYTDVARPGQRATISRRATASKVKNGQRRTDLAEVRAWAHTHGHTVSSRGRIPTAVLDAYNQQH